MPKTPRKNNRASGFRRIGFVVKRRHGEAAELAIELARLALSEGGFVYLADESPGITRKLLKTIRTHSSPAQNPKVLVKRVSQASKHKLPELCDLILVLGGDGTLLGMARWMRSKTIPILGINMGTLGFLTEVKRTEAVDVFSYLLSGKRPRISQRSMLEVRVFREEKCVYSGPVINDAVVSKGAIARIIGMQVLLGGQVMNEFRADGLIVSSPTGSTAYSLAAGGPILAPDVPAFILTPICPHSLVQRPVVLSDRAEIEIRFEEKSSDLLLTLDGQELIPLKRGDRVLVRKFRRHPLKIVSSTTRNYFSLLTEKLKFGMKP